jgi:hypothetical protein
VKVERIGIDSRVLGRSVLAVHEFDASADFASFERRYIAEYDPVYVSVKIPLERIAEVHDLESAGFHLVECQIRSRVKLRKLHDVSAFPYDFERVTREVDLGEVLDIAGTTFVHDRFRVDGSIDPGAPGARYREYVRQSFLSPDEAVYRLVDRSTGHTVAFKTHRYVSETEVLFLLGGVHPDYKNLGLGLINEYFEFNELIGKGIRHGVTHISAANYPVFNLEIGNLGFRVLTTFAVLRKIYSSAAAGHCGSEA